MVGNFTQGATDVLTIDFDLNVKYGDAPTGLDFGVSATDSWSWAINDRFLVYAGGFRVFRQNGDELGSARTHNAWYHIRYEINLATDTYNLIIDNERYEDLTFVRPADTLICMYVTGYWGSTDTFYMDNVVVDASVTPPPQPVGRLFFDDFENVSAVHWPDLTQEADPVAQIGSWSSLEARDTSGNHQPECIQVSNNSVPGSVGGGSNYLTFDRDHWSFMAGSWVKECDFSESVIVVEFDCYIPSTNPDPSGLEFAIQEGTVYSVVDQVIYNGFYYSPNWFGAYGPGFRVMANGDYLNSWLNLFAADTWHHVRYDIDLTADTYDLTISGVRYSDIPFVKAADSVGHMWFGGLYAGTVYYLDNVIVGVPHSVCLAPLKADFNGNCMVDMDDFTFFLNYWMTGNMN
jgi:hypothetical protein